MGDGAISSEFLSNELRRECAVTRRLLERLPDEGFDWRPHSKSMTLGRLAGHLAELPSWAVRCLTTPFFDISTAEFRAEVGTSRERVLENFDRNAAAALEALEGRDEDYLRTGWRLLMGDRELFQHPREEVVRRVVLYHMIHHRGQLSVYLRMLDAFIPQIYGPSADENAMF